MKKSNKKAPKDISATYKDNHAQMEKGHLKLKKGDTKMSDREIKPTRFVTIPEMGNMVIGLSAKDTRTAEEVRQSYRDRNQSLINSLKKNTMNLYEKGRRK